MIDEEGYILFVRKNALQILIPKYGLEGTVYLDDVKAFIYDEEVGTEQVLQSSETHIVSSFIFV